MMKAERSIKTYLVPLYNNLSLQIRTIWKVLFLSITVS
jgi:hypothetical protein